MHQTQNFARFRRGAFILTAAAFNHKAP